MAKKNYKILKNDIFGRYMVANKNIKEGELILKENPALVGPKMDGPLTCFNCCRNVRNTGYIFCKNCNKAVICSPKCIGNQHNTEECSALKEANITGDILADYNQIMFPLRCVLLKKYNPKVWQEFMKLEPHLEKRRDTPIWRRHRVIVEQILREVNFLSEEDLREELVQKVCGILDVNSFEIRPANSTNETVINPEIQRLRGIYLEAALMAHDCLGNSHLSVDDDFVLTVHASVNIPENSPIFFNYSNPLEGSVARKEHLREGKYFECVCERCKDTTELGTEMSSLKCHNCRKGLIRLIDPQKINSDWKCSHCERTFRSGLINTTVEEGRRRIKEIGNTGRYQDQSNVNDMENLLTTLSRTFHSNHYLMLELQQNIAGLYLSVPPNKKNLLRKITLCQGLLDVFAKIEPGLSRMKALALYELQSAMVDLAHKHHMDKEISSEELVIKLLSAESTLKDAIKHLLYEPPKSPEGKVAQRALMELKMLRASINSMQNSFLSNSTKNNASRKPGRKVKNNEKKTEQTTEIDKQVESDKECKLQSNKKRRNKKKNREI